MNKRRLLKLADLLEADAKNKKGIKFDIGAWGYSDSGEFTVSCGTTACAMGLAVVSGAFKRAGLRARYIGSADDGGVTMIPIFGSHHGFDAAVQLFGISPGDAEYLFSGDHYAISEGTGARGERTVAKRIRAFVAANP